jgi:phosphoribosylformimino-5-aminoimidazole carboxamide ribotide isomerase
MLIYPAIDIYNGKCVRLQQGNYAAQTVYPDSPMETARSFLDDKLSFLHVVDLEGAKEGHLVNQRSIEAVLGLPGVQAQVGGGVRTREDVSYLFIAGATRILIGSLAVKSPHIVQDWLREFQSERFVIAVDIRRGAVVHSGWLERANLTPAAFIDSMAQFGAIHFLCTDVERDGMLAGPSFALYTSLATDFPSLQFIASGGVSQLTDIRDLEVAGCSGVVVGKALYEGRLKAKELARYGKH